MSRSSKKKPFVEEKLLKRIDAMNESGKKEVIKQNKKHNLIFWKLKGKQNEIKKNN